MAVNERIFYLNLKGGRSLPTLGEAYLIEKPQTLSSGTAKDRNPHMRLKHLLVDMSYTEARVALTFFIGELGDTMFTDIITQVERKQSSALIEKRGFLEKEVLSEDQELVERRSKMWANLDFVIARANIKKPNGREEWIDLIDSIQSTPYFEEGLDRLSEDRASDFDKDYTEKVRSQIKAWDDKRISPEKNKIDQEFTENQTWTDFEYIGQMIVNQSRFINKSGIPMTDLASVNKLNNAGIKLAGGLMDTIVKVGLIVESQLEGQHKARFNKNKRDDDITYERFQMLEVLYYILLKRHKKQFVGFREAEIDEQKQRVSSAIANIETVKFLNCWKQVLIFLKSKYR